MEEKKKKFNWARFVNILFAAVVIAIWVYSYISLCDNTLTGEKMLALVAASFSWFIYYLRYSKDPYLTRIEKLEEDKLELQARIEQMKIDSKKKSAKSKKND